MNFSWHHGLLKLLESQQPINSSALHGVKLTTEKNEERRGRQGDHNSNNKLTDIQNKLNVIKKSLFRGK